MASAKPSFIPSFQALFRASLESRQRSTKANDDDRMQEEKVHGYDDDIFDDLVLFEDLRKLGWIRKNGILMQPLGAALHRGTLYKVRATISGNFEDEGLFETVKAWTVSTVEAWVRDVLGLDVFEQENWSTKLQHCAAECFCLVRIDEIFDIVCEFPDSKPAVSELREVLSLTRMHSQLGDALRDSLVRRLNHPGANTSQIIGKYFLRCCYF